MLLEWFNANQAINAGLTLADQFSSPPAAQPGHRRRKQPAAGRQPSSLGDFLHQAERHLAPLQLNFYKKAKLANSFKWRLLENGVERSVADEVTQSLITHLSLNRRLTASSEGHEQRPATTAHPKQLLQQADRHFAANEMQAAVDCYRTALTQHPKNAVANNNLGAALCQLGRPDEALQYLRKAISIRPDYADAHHNLALIFRSRGELAVAEQYGRQALRHKPNHIEARIGLGMTLLAGARPAEARTHLEKVLRISPRHPDALLGLGQIAAVSGDFAAAEARYRKVLEASPNSAGAWAALVSLRKMTPADAPWLEHAERILSSPVRPIEEATLRFAMGKYCDDVSQFDQAFSNYQRGNQILKPLAGKFNGEAYANFADRMIAGYTQAAISQAASAASASQQPIFVVGMMRSGTSLAEQIIASHPQASGAGDLSFWSDAIQRADADILQPPDKATRDKLALDYLQLLKRRAGSAERIVDKTPVNSDYLGLIHSVFPKARIIYMRRDPLDTCLSCYFQPFTLSMDFSFDLDDLAEYYRQHRRLIAHWKSVLPLGTILEVPYEELVADQRAWTARILEFSGLPWDERCLEFQQTQRPVAPASAWQVRQKLYNGSVERWRKYANHIGPLRALSKLG